MLAATGRVLLSETITLLPPADNGGGAGAGAGGGEGLVGSMLEAVHSCQEVKEDGSLGGVQLWRSRKVSES